MIEKIVFPALLGSFMFSETVVGYEAVRLLVLLRLYTRVYGNTVRLNRVMLWTV